MDVRLVQLVKREVCMPSVNGGGAERDPQKVEKDSCVILHKKLCGFYHSESTPINILQKL